MLSRKVIKSTSSTNMSSSERQKFEYESEKELLEDYKSLLSNHSNLSLATEYIFESLVEEAVMGVAFQMHFESKFPVGLSNIFIQNFFNSTFDGCLSLQEVFTSNAANHEDSKKASSSSHNDYGASNSNKFLNCKCLNCDKTVSYLLFLFED